MFPLSIVVGAWPVPLFLLSDDGGRAPRRIRQREGKARIPYLGPEGERNMRTVGREVPPHFGRARGFVGWRVPDVGRAVVAAGGRVPRSGKAPPGEGEVVARFGSVWLPGGPEAPRCGRRRPAGRDPIAHPRNGTCRRVGRIARSCNGVAGLSGGVPHIGRQTASDCPDAPPLVFPANALGRGQDPPFRSYGRSTPSLRRRDRLDGLLEHACSDY